MGAQVYKEAPPDTASDLTRRDLPYLLINPPLTDPTTAYHSIPYLIGTAEREGFGSGEALDANVEALNWMADPERVTALIATAREVREGSELKASLTRREQMRYRSALTALGLTPESVRAALTTFRSPPEFYDYRRYRAAVQIVRRWVAALGLNGPTDLIDSRTLSVRSRGPINLLCSADLIDPASLREVDGLFAPYWDGPFTERLHRASYGVVGISVNYLSQVPFAVALDRRVRLLLPDALIVYGGTAITDIVKYQTESTVIWSLLENADVIVPGEGEHAFASILRQYLEDRRVAPGPGLMVRDGTVGDPNSLVVYENVDRLAPPNYQVWDWAQYWSPEPVLLYSPTRGCYWNKCTFCDYGLNTDRPTSPSRARAADHVIADLEAATAVGSTFYFAVDAMAPSYLRKLAVALDESALDLGWAAELKLERSLPRWGLGRQLKDAGCVAISFGYESGSQRVLDLIRKGVQLRDVPAVLSELAEANIGAQMMGFTGFPSETDAEARETFQFLIDHEDLWTIAGIGRFLLTGRAIVAKEPERFGVSLLPNPPSEDIHVRLRWEHNGGPATAHADLASLEQRALRFPDDRPFVGGIDSAHSILYFRRNGRSLVPVSEVRRVNSFTPLTHSVEYETPFEAPEEFASADDFRELHDQLERSGGATRALLDAWLDEPEYVERVASRTRPVLVEPGGKIVRVSARAVDRSAAFIELRDRLLTAIEATPPVERIPAGQSNS